MAYSGSVVLATEGMVDLRSDTVSRPTLGMRDAMARAVVGDDVFGDDPTVISLQERVADMLGKDAALLVPSGTQSNLSAMLAHCGRGEEYIAGRSYHVYSNEAGGAAVLGSIAPCTIPVDEIGAIRAEDIKTAIKPDDAHCPISRLLCVENTVSGCVQDQGNLEACAKLAHDHGMVVHLDGARLMNATVAQGLSVQDMVDFADSVSLCLSKGLGTPLGSVLAGSNEFIARAYRWRKMLGGGMRQAGIIAAAGHFALDHHVERLAEDHVNAKRLSQALSEIDGMSCDPAATQTNMVFVTPPPGSHKALRKYMLDQGIAIIGDKGAIRLVTHLDVSAKDIEKVIEAFGQFANSYTHDQAA